MRYNKIFIWPVLGALIISINGSNVETGIGISKKDISQALLSMKYSNSAGNVDNLYSTEVQYNDFINYGKIYVSDPNIQAVFSYGTKKFELVNYTTAGTVERPDGEKKYNYVATYVYKKPVSSIQTYTATINNGHLDSISCSFETTNKFDISTTIEKEVGIGGNLCGIEAKAGIRKFFNAAAGYGSGNKFTLEYDLDGDAIKLNKKYSIRKTTDYYEFISVVYIAKYSRHKNWFWETYEWENYLHYSYLTNSITLDSYTLVES